MLEWDITEEVDDWRMNQREAVIHVMEKNGGYATLSHLYEHALKVPGVLWKTKTPFASIRRIVQNEKYFFRIQPGLWALEDYREKIPFGEQIDEKADEEVRKEFSHTYFQGLLVEIGNLKQLSTFIPNQDKNKKFLNKPLKEFSTLDAVIQFGYEKFVNVARTIDVSWFNQREMPDTFIEVEHSTNIYNSLIKFVELQDFHTKFWVAAPTQRHREFKEKLGKSAFHQIGDRVKFISYDDVSRLHSSLHEKALAEKGLYSA